MTAKEYIEQKLEGIKDITVKQDKKLADFIFERIMSKKFRKYSVNPEANNIVRKAIELNIQNHKPITDVYEKGVWFDFCGDDAILELMNNIPEEDTEKYKKAFRNLIDFIQPYLPENFRYTFSPVGERYSSKEEFLADLNEKVKELKQKGD